MNGFLISWAAARVNAGLTQDEAANAMKVSKNTINNWENYKTMPNVMQARELCKIYGCPLDVVDMCRLT